MPIFSMKPQSFVIFIFYLKYAMPLITDMIKPLTYSLPRVSYYFRKKLPLIKWKRKVFIK